VLFDEAMYPCDSGGGEKLPGRASASVVGGLGVWLGLYKFTRQSQSNRVARWGQPACTCTLALSNAVKKKKFLPGIHRRHFERGVDA
jgi:hypothetical protein